MRFLSRSLLCVGALTASISAAQATRVWVSGVGDDANPCSRTAPCLTLAGAFPKVASNGELNLLDPVDFGQATITHSLVMSGEVASLAQPSGTAGLIINAPGATVQLRNLHFSAIASGVPAIEVQAAAAVHIEHCRFTGFSGDVVTYTAPGGALYIDGSLFRGNQARGVSVTATAPQVTVITDSEFHGHTTAVWASGPAGVTVVDSVLANNSGAAVRVENGAQVNVERGALVDSMYGADAFSGRIRLSNSLISGDGATTRTVADAVVHSYGNNRFVPTTCAVNALPAGVATVGVELPPTSLEGYGLLGDVTWSAALPTGVGIDGGVISGTPMAVGHVTGSLSATDGRGCSASTALDLDVVCPALVVVPTALTAVETGTQLSPITFSAANSTSASATVIVDGGLPIGVSVTDGVLSGLPTEPGNFPLEVTVVDGFGCTASSSLTFTVNASATYQATTLALSAVTPAYALTSTSLVATLGGFTGAPTGTVTFSEGTTELGSAAMTSAGTATLDVDTLTAGTHVLTATYFGDATFGGSHAAAFTLEVVRIPTSTTLALQDTSLVASVTSTVAQPAGYVQFTVDGVAQAPVPVNASGLATISAPTSVGMHTAQADFVENDRFSASSAMTLAVNIVTDGGMTSDGGMSANDGGTTTGNDGGTGGSEPPKPGCGCSQVDVGAMLLAALALFRRRARS